MYDVKPFYVRQQEQEEQRKREEKERKDAASDYGYVHNNGDLTHDTWEPKQRRAPDKTPWLTGRAEQRVEEEKAQEEHRKRDAAFERGYEYINGHLVPLQGSRSASAHGGTRGKLKPLPREPLPREPLPREPLSSSTYMVCTQAALNTSGLRPLPNFVEKLQLLETQVGTLQQQIQDIDAMRNEIKHMGYKLTEYGTAKFEKTQRDARSRGEFGSKQASAYIA
jgi:hypothetical protein